MQLDYGKNVFQYDIDIFKALSCSANQPNHTKCALWKAQPYEGKTHLGSDTRPYHAQAQVAGRARKPGSIKRVDVREFYSNT